MSVYGASFVRARPDRATSFRETSRLLREANASRLAASPTNLTIEHTVRITEGSDWISIQNPLADQLLETISRVEGTTAIAIYAIDEMVLRFSYSRFDDGVAVRRLKYEDDGNPKTRGGWTKVEGKPEPWEEAILFSPRLMELYGKSGPDEEGREACAKRKIQPGVSIPWACDGSTIAELARALQLPWQPLDDRFPPATQTEVIPGSPERWKVFHRQRRRPWWKFWIKDD